MRMFLASRAPAFARTFLLGLLTLFAATFAACASNASRTVKQAYMAGSDGTIAPATRSAIDGTTDAGGPQEIIAVYVPLLGSGLAIKGGLVWDGTTWAPGGQQPQAASFAAPAACYGAQSQACQVAQTQTVWVDETVMVPQTRRVPKQVTTMVPSLSVPIPQAQAAPCQPIAPQAAPCR